MVRRIIPTAERTVTRGGDKKPLTKETRLENGLRASTFFVLMSVDRVFGTGSGLKLREFLARLVCNVMRLDDGASSGD
jgi:hypothetical protein